MFKIFLLLTGLIISFSQAAWTNDSDRAIDQKVHRLLSQMTLEEKVGQMTQLNVDVVSAGKDGLGEPHMLDDAKLIDILIDHHVGSILNVTSDSDRHHWFTAEHWQEVIRKIQEVAVHKSRLGIPVIYGIDGIHGATFTEGATLFPQAIGMAATFNPELLTKEGEVTSREIKASGIPWNFAPVVDVGRQPLWPRLYETLGEDTYLVTTLGAAYLKGHKDAAPCLKHFAGYSFSWSGKDRAPIYMTERMLRDVFLPSFEAGIKAGAPTLMINSSNLDLAPTHANYHLLTEILRKELHFKGFTVSDWFDVKRLFTRDHVAKDPKDAVRIAVMAGVDMSMVPLDLSFYNYLIELVNEKKVPMSRIDEAVGRILRVKYQIGLFEHPFPDPSLVKNIALPDATEANLMAAQESITLLKNDKDTLPLKKSAKILLAGPNANLLSVLNGGWTITWQGSREELYPKNKKTVLAAIRDKVGSDHVMIAQDDEDAAKKASSVDAIVLCLGEKPYTEGRGNIDNLTLDESQLQLAKKLENSGKPVILVMIEGRPRVIRPIVDGAKAVLLAYLPGMEGGRAIADVLFGDVNPSGKLPYTYPRAPNDLVHYDHTLMEETDDNNYNPEFQFGTGGSYTSFEYSFLNLKKDELANGEPLKLSVRVKNTGKIAGKETVMLYLGETTASIMRPAKLLKGFQKVDLQPGETREVEFVVPAEAFSFINAKNKRVIEPGEFKVSVGPLFDTFEVGSLPKTVLRSR